jgi:hypothetical protein
MLQVLVIPGSDGSHFTPALWFATEAARQRGAPHVFEVQGGDHGLHVPGPLARSAAILGRLATAVEDFLDNVIWPADTI